MAILKTLCLGYLAKEATLVRSGNKLVADTPRDKQHKGKR
jgi:hypothetical protein